MNNSGSSIVFFDGECVLCNSSVRLLLKIDKRRVLKYSSLQGTFAKENLNLQNTKVAQSLIFWHNETVYKRSEAVVHILIELGGLYKYLGIALRIIPCFLSSLLYDFIANNRYNFFGKSHVCLIPADKDKDLFIP